MIIRNRHFFLRDSRSVRADFLSSVILLADMGFQLAGTPGTAAYYNARNLNLRSLSKPPDDDVSDEGALTWIRQGKIDLVINIPEGTIRSDEVSAGYLIRRASVDFGASLLTNLKYLCALLYLTSSDFFSQVRISLL